MGTSLHSCVEVHELIELSFGVMSGVAPVIDVLDGVHITKGKGLFGGFFGICTPIGLNGQNDIFFAQKCI